MINLIKKFFNRLSSKRIPKEGFDKSRPFTSQNTWMQLVGFYTALSKPPRILEYGSGFSTYYHLENLMKQGGELVSVEHDKDWFNTIWNSFVKIYKDRLDNFQITKNGPDRVFEGIIRGTQKKVTFTFFYRPSTSRTGCGTEQEFESYIKVPTGTFDVVVVDGRARKACVNHVLDSQLLNDGSLLVLYEAGRGNAVWPKKSQMTDTYDYQPEVRKLVSLGATVVDGNGYDVWDGWIPDRSSKNGMATYVPMEACFYVHTR